MSNTYLKVTIEEKTFSKRSQNFDFLGFKNCHHVSYGELQLTNISLNFKTSYSNLKIRGMGAKLCVAFPLFSF